MPDKYKPNLVIDFDGTLTPYEKGWQGINIIDEKPIPGTMKFLHEAVEHFTVHIFSSRSEKPEGIRAMREWIEENFKIYMNEKGEKCPEEILKQIHYPTTKPAAFLSIDDRVLRFDGDWSKIIPEELLSFKPWNRKQNIVENNHGLGNSLCKE